MTITKIPATLNTTASATASASATCNVTVPGGLAVGDLAVFAITIEDSRTLAADAYFDEAWQATDPTSGVTLAVWTRTITSVDLSLSDWEFVASGTTEWAVAAAFYDTPASLYSVGEGNGGDLTTPSIYESQALLADQAAGVVYVGGARGSSTIGFTAPSGFIERVDVGHSSGATRLRATIADDTEWTFGDAGPWTATASGSPSKMAAGYLFIAGELDFTTPTLAQHPNDRTAFDVPFADGVHRVYAGWSGAVLLAQAQIGGSAFRLNDDTYGLLNVGRLGPSEDGWVDLGDLLEVSITAGGTQDDGVLTRMEAGQCRLVLNDWDGRWDPLNSDSPYAQDWRLGCKVRIHANAVEQLDVHNPATDTVAYAMPGLFTGRVESMVASGYADEDPIVSVSCVDDVAFLAAANPPAQGAAGAGDDLDARALRITANAGWDGEVNSDVGHPDWPTATYQATTLAQPAWTELLLACDAGMVGPVIRGNGDLYLTPLAPDTDTYQASRFGYDEDSEVVVVSLDLAFDRDQLRNAVTVARVGGSEQTFTDANSVTRHGRVDWSRNDLPIEDDTDVEVLGRRILGYSSDPTPRVTGITVWPQLFGPGKYHDVDLYVGGTLTLTNSLPWYYTLSRMASYRLANADLITVRFVHPRTGRETEQLVQARGVEVRITADEWQYRFVTSSVAAWFDVWTLADPSDSLAEAEQSRLSRGHRLAST